MSRIETIYFHNFEQPNENPYYLSIMTPFDQIISSIDNSRLTDDLLDWAAEEIVYLECNEPECIELLKLKENKVVISGNPTNSTLLYALNLTDTKPTDEIKRTPTSPPDFDFDTNMRDKIKKYLVEKYGKDHVVLLGTYQTLKTKGAIKDVCKYLKPDLRFDEVNAITAKFILNRNEFDSEVEFFEESLNNDKTLSDWFEANSDVKEAVVALLGTAKSSGIHAGGIVLCDQDVKLFCPLTYDVDEGLFVTQYEMGSVESVGLIKNDFLGLKTLGDIIRCIRIIHERYSLKLRLSQIPLNDEEVLKDFHEGNTLSVFQFNTPLATAGIKSAGKVEGIGKLAMVTSLERRGPLQMGMDKVFFARDRGEEEIEYLHPAMKDTLDETLGVMIYQEQVMAICKILGSFTGDEALTVMKAMGKKKRDVLESFQGRFIDSCNTKKIPPNISKQIWDLMESFAEYGFNKSHAVAYATMSYLCMWFMHYYPLEWKTAVLMDATKEDFKLFYTHWKDSIINPHINDSKESFFINASGKIVMPFNAINGIGDKVVPALVSLQPYSSFSDFYSRIHSKLEELKATIKQTKAEIEEMPLGDEKVKKELQLDSLKTEQTSFSRALSKATVESLILSGSFNCFKPEGMHPAIFIKETLRESIYLKHKYNTNIKVADSPLISKKNKVSFETTVKDLNALFALPSSHFSKGALEEIREDREYLDKFERLKISDFLYEELKLLNISSYDYFEYFGEGLYTYSKNNFGLDLKQPEDIFKMSDKQKVVVAGAIESITFVPIKKEGKNKGREMCRILLTHNGHSIECTAFPDTLEKETKIRTLKELHPLMVCGKVNQWQGKISVTIEKCEVPFKKDENGQKI